MRLSTLKNSNEGQVAERTKKHKSLIKSTHSRKSKSKNRKSEISK